MRGHKAAAGGAARAEVQSGQWHLVSKRRRSLRTRRGGTTSTITGGRTGRHFGLWCRLRSCEFERSWTNSTEHMMSALKRSRYAGQIPAPLRLRWFEARGGRSPRSRRRPRARRHRSRACRVQAQAAVLRPTAGRGVTGAADVALAPRGADPRTPPMVRGTRRPLTGRVRAARTAAHKSSKLWTRSKVVVHTAGVSPRGRIWVGHPIWVRSQEIADLVSQL